MKTNVSPFFEFSKCQFKTPSVFYNYHNLKSRCVKGVAGVTKGVLPCSTDNLTFGKCGKTYFPNDVSELNGIATDIASELRTQYIVSYYPSNTKKDGTTRQIKVVIPDGANKQKRIAITRTSRKAGN